LWNYHCQSLWYSHSRLCNFQHNWIEIVEIIASQRVRLLCFQ